MGIHANKNRAINDIHTNVFTRSLHFPSLLNAASRIERSARSTDGVGGLPGLNKRGIRTQRQQRRIKRKRSKSFVHYLFIFEFQIK